jgi:hypothetical protein
MYMFAELLLMTGELTARRHFYIFKRWPFKISSFSVFSTFKIAELNQPNEPSTEIYVCKTNNFNFLT